MGGWRTSWRAKRPEDDRYEVFMKRLSWKKAKMHPALNKKVAEGACHDPSTNRSHRIAAVPS
eukprot:11967419-Prorocentrum_lima.AAC.1